jgi:hypothetical protein
MPRIVMHPIHHHDICLGRLSRNLAAGVELHAVARQHGVFFSIRMFMGNNLACAACVQSVARSTATAYLAHAQMVNSQK